MNIVTQYRSCVCKNKILTNEMEIYQNDYYNIGKEKCSDKLKEIQTLYDKNMKFINEYEVVYNNLSDEEKFYINERYGEHKSQKELAIFYLENPSRIANISPYEEKYNEKFKLESIRHYLSDFNKKILNKLKRYAIA